MNDHRSYAHNLSSREIKTCKKKKNKKTASTVVAEVMSPNPVRDLNFFSIFSGLNFTFAQLVCITAVTNHVFLSFSAVQI